jgi:hypothetical protein
MFLAGENALASWLASEVSAVPLQRFRLVFAATWLGYDVSDWYFRGTWLALAPAAALTGGEPPVAFMALGLHAVRLTSLQLALILVELGLLLGWAPGAFSFALCFLRTCQAAAFGALNDFLYVIMTSGLMGVATLDIKPWRRPAHVPRWAVDVLRVQLGFTYLATGFLKLSPTWLSGDHLYVQIAYLRELSGWRPPLVLLHFVETAPGASVLAWCGVVAEITLGILIVRGKRHGVALALAVCIHGFAMLAVGVWFFGISMVAHVALLGRRIGPETPSFLPPPS